MPNYQKELFIAKPKIKAGAVINLVGNGDQQYGTVTRTGNTLRLFACVNRGGISTKKRSQTVEYSSVRVAKEMLTYMVGKSCEAQLPVEF